MVYMYTKCSQNWNHWLLKGGSGGILSNKTLQQNQLHSVMCDWMSIKSNKRHLASYYYHIADHKETLGRQMA